MLQNDPNKRFEFQDRPSAAILTAMLIFLLILMYSVSHGLMAPGGRAETWLANNCYSLPRATALLEKKDFSSLMALGFCTTFSSWNMVQMAFNMYFLWVFGKHVETKLGAARYIFLIMLGIFVPIAVLHFDMAHAANDTTWIGTAFLSSTMIGTYMVFPPLPKSKMKGDAPKNKNEIYKRGGRPDPLDKYIANPFMFVITFVILQMGMHYWVTLQKPFYFFEGMAGVDIIAAYPIIAGALIGYLIGASLEQQATAALKESPMTLSAVKRYHEMIDMDVTHDDALRGTARSLGVPYEKVKQWVKKNKGSMRIK